MPDNLWYTRKPYLHFDQALSYKQAEQLVTNPSRVASHAFYPFLAYKLVTPRIRKAPTGAGRPFVPDTKERPISYPAHKDGYIFAYYKACLEKIYEQWVAENRLYEAITAFRSTGENNVTLAKRAFDFIKANPAYSVIVSDVNSFFPNINHSLLKMIWAYFLGSNRLPLDHFAVYKAITRFGEVDRHKAYNAFRIPLNTRPALDRICTPREFRAKVAGRLVRPNPGLAHGIGIPQGSSLSPLLSNMYMASLDLSMHKWAASIGGAYWRYCDDILVVAPCTSTKILWRLDQELASVYLQRSEEKTHCYPSGFISARRPLQYLGFMFDGHSVTVRPSSVHRYHRKLKAAIKVAQYRRQRETNVHFKLAPLHKRALYNMYSERPRHGTKIVAAMKIRKYRGNFTHYLERAADTMGSVRVSRQRNRVLKRFRDRIRKAG